MDSAQIKTLVSLGEGYQAEFKVSVPSKVRDLTAEVCAFANAAGGVLLIGVDDDNNIKGVNIPNAQRSAIQNSINEIDPTLNFTLEIVNVDGLDVGVIEVPSGKRKPYIYAGAIYVRVGPNTQKLTTVEEMRDFFQQSEKIYFDESPCRAFDISKDMDTPFLETFSTDAGFHSSITNEQILANLQVFSEENVFKSGAVLFFGTHPEAIFEQAIVRCVAFKGHDKRFITDDKKFGGPLFIQYKQAIEWIRGKINIGYDIEGQGAAARKELWEIPETVFKEAIINALSHRDYYEKGAVTTIEVFDDRIEISNPGGLLSAIKHEFGKRSLSRNPLIFGLFDRMHLVERIGSGIPRMEELMQGQGLDVPEYRTDGMFTIVLKRSVKASEKDEAVEKTSEKDTGEKPTKKDDTVEKTREKTSEKTRKTSEKNPFEEDITKESTKEQHTREKTTREKTTREKIIQAIQQNNAITTSELAKVIGGISTKGIEYQLKKLKKDKIIIRIGPDKGGYWRVNESKHQ
jgi:ATP-dependent DNA helicase RecG